MNLIQAIRANDARRCRAKIRKLNREIQRKLYELPYCSKCKSRVLRRAPCKHLTQPDTT